MKYEKGRLEVEYTTFWIAPFSMHVNNYCKSDLCRGVLKGAERDKVLHEGSRDAKKEDPRNKAPHEGLIIPHENKKASGTPLLSSKYV